MDAIVNDMTQLFSSVTSELRLINSNWSSNLSNNFAGKITSTKKTFSELLDTISEGSAIAKTSARSFESIDSALSNAFSDIVTTATNAFNNIIENIKEPGLDVENCCKKVSDAEYARLCKLAYDAIKKDDPTEAFWKLLQNDDYLPDNDPIKNIKLGQIDVYDSCTGFSAFVINDGDTAIVIFVGTNGDIGDFVSDAELPLGVVNPQSIQANKLIDKIAEEHDNIVVTGHSLGGFLATSATLHNENVSECVAFEAPGRRDKWYHELFHGDRVDKVTTYNAKGSLISEVGSPIGDVTDVEVKESGGAIAHNHSIKNLCDALNKDDAIKKSWAN